MHSVGQSSAQIRARRVKNDLFQALVFFLGFMVVVPFLIVLYHVIRNGIRVINFEFLFHLPKPVGESGGGIVNAILGTLTVIIIAMIFSVPLGVTTGVYVAEARRSSRLAPISRLSVDILQSVPSIVIGIVMYTWIVVPLRSFSAFAGGIALAIMMIPVIVKSTEETVKLVPNTLKEASMALGAPYHKTILRVVIPTGLSGIMSGVTLAVARVAGETAPLLFTAFGNPFFNYNPFGPVSAIPLVIYDYAKSPYTSWISMAWGASFVLIVLVLILNVVVRLVKFARKSLQ